VLGPHCIGLLRPYEFIGKIDLRYVYEINVVSRKVTKLSVM